MEGGSLLPLFARKRSEPGLRIGFRRAALVSARVESGSKLPHSIETRRELPWGAGGRRGHQSSSTFFRFRGFGLSSASACSFGAAGPTRKV